MATQSPQSLPSFAQTFGTGPANFNRVQQIDNALPPIHNRASPFSRNQPSPAQSASTPQPTMEPTTHKPRKRIHAESAAAESDESQPSDNGRRSPRTVRIKEENDPDTLPPTIQPRQPNPRRESVSSTPPPNPAKKRRVTVSGLAPPINTDVRRPSMDSGISPVVMGFTIQRDDPAALEQVRSMLSVKQKQKALIEQRRGSTAGIVAPVAPPSVNIVNPRPGSEEIQAPSTRASLRGGRSPNVANNGRRRSVAAAPPAASRPLSPNPPPPMVPTQQQPPPQQKTAAQDTQQHSSPPQVPVTAPSHLHPSASSGSNTAPPPPSSNSLPLPSASFGRRRAGRVLGGGKAKPADIMISTQASSSNLVPSIHSAPPIPRAGQQPGRFPSTMAIPALPAVIGSSQAQAPRRLTSGQVPPTPTRLTLGRNSVAHPGVGGISGRSPNAASVPIATTLVPPTPASLHHPEYSGEKSAFLAPFGMFYDALSDSKDLKKWLAEQLHKSGALITALQRQHDHMEETINSIVDKKVSAMREEVYGLRVRVDELEQALRIKGSSSLPLSNYSPGTAAMKLKGKVNGHHVAHSVSTSNAGPPPIFDNHYTFPPIDPHSRHPHQQHQGLSSPDVDPRSVPGSQTSSPVSFDVSKRQSVSAIRLDPPMRGSGADPLPPRVAFRTERDRERERERDRDRDWDRDRDASGSYPTPLSGGGGGRRSPPLPPPQQRGLPTSSTRSSLNHSHSISSISSIRGTAPSSSSSQPQHQQRYSVAADRHQYQDGTASSDPSGEGRTEKSTTLGGREQAARGEGERENPSGSAQRRNSIAVPPSSARGERGPSRPRSPMDTT
ncbi:hypothetical protein BXZ70DRAFT_1005326 [Cristinia sonorae]|uniref:Uncharacterized protein n=1 Tax=Cristinia sonorae TaxID=1940300 RepID=A0A8K0UW54_9AGAR|nr:hypothetical protein BXZ70DRAFT_1005326 [Cristinia sonorae]